MNELSWIKGGTVNACPHGTFVNTWCPYGCGQSKGEPLGVVTKVDRENRIITISTPPKVTK